MNRSIINMKVKILPDIDVTSFDGSVILAKEINRQAIIIKLDSPFNYESHYYEYIIAFPRHRNNLIGSLSNNERVFCSLMRLPPEIVNSKDPFDTSWWRGGGAFLGDVEPISCGTK